MNARTIGLALLLAGCSGASSPPPADGHDHDHAHPDHVAHHKNHGGMQHDFSDAAMWTKRFDAAERDAWQKPDEVVKLLALSEGMVAVDLGAGTGYFGARLSKAVGSSGKVLALDVEPKMVDFMTERFKKESLSNVEAKVCPMTGTGLAEASADRVLIVDTWHHLGDRAAYAKHLASVLKPGGSVVVVDFTLETDKGPPKEHRLSAEQVIAELKSGGLVGSVLAETLPDQYVVSAKKP